MNFLSCRRIRRVQHDYGHASCKSAHEGNHELDGAVGEDHNDIAIGDASVMELVGQYVGRLIDLFVGGSPRRSGRRSRLRDARPVGVRSSIFLEDVMDSPNPAAPVEMDGRIPLL